MKCFVNNNGCQRKSEISLLMIVRDLVYSDSRIKVEEIANALYISHGSVSTTLHDHLGMQKLTAIGSQNPLATLVHLVHHSRGQLHRKKKRDRSHPEISKRYSTFDKKLTYASLAMFDIQYLMSE